MKKFPKMLSLIFALGVFSISCGLNDLVLDVFSRLPQPLELYVTTSGNDANDCLSVETACLTLPAALEKATLSSTIHIGPGDFPVEHGIILNSITLSGAGVDQTVLRAAAATSDADDPIFLIEGQNPVFIRELEITGISGSNVQTGIDVDGSSSLTLENCRVTQTRNGVRVQRAGTVTIGNCTIARNTIGILVEGATAHILNYYGDTRPSTNHGSAVINNNTVIEGNTTGISNDGIVSLNAVMLQQNINAFYNEGYASVYESTFDGNHDGRVVSNAGAMTISRTTFSNNNGIAIFNSVDPYLISAFGETYDPADRRADLTISEVQVIGNERSLAAPCAIVNEEGRLLIGRTNIQDNRCIGVDVYTGTVEIFQSSIIGNDTGLFVRDEASVTVTNTTVSGNYFFGIEQVDNGSLALINVTVANNPGVQLSAGRPALLVMTDTVVAPGCSINISPSEFICNGSWTETTLGLGPLTEESGTFSHPLLPDSPLIDAGVARASCQERDQRNNSRPMGLTCDIGAYEKYGSVVEPLEFVTPSGETPGVIQLYTETPQAPAPIILTFTKNAYCRKGPGVLYRDISGFKQGDTAQAEGRNDADPRWWWVQMPNSTEHCWISYTTVATNDLAEGLPIQPMASLELPQPPGEFAISKRVCTAKSYALKFAWTKSSDADGYILYRDGQEIATLKATQTTFDEIPSMNQYHLYELASFNADGYSERLGVEDSCP